MSAQAAAARYQSVQAKTVSPAKLVHMLFEGALRFCNEAEHAMRAGDRGRAGERIGRCHAVVAELAASLDAEKAPDLCEQLSGIYAFCMRRLVEANLARDPALLAEVRTALTPLAEAWAEIE